MEISLKFPSWVSIFPFQAFGLEILKERSRQVAKMSRYRDNARDETQTDY